MSLPVKTLKNGFSLPVLGLGTWKMGGDRHYNPDNDDQKDIAAIQLALELGFTHFDTAESYADGHAEVLLGQGIAEHERSALTIASKIWPQNMAYDNVIPSLRASLKRLNQEYLDIYYLHEANHDVPFADTAKALNEAYQEGLIKNVAVANFLPETFDKMQSHLQMPIVANQVHYNLMNREPVVHNMLEHAQKNDYLIVAWRPIRFSHRNHDAKDVWHKGEYPIVDEMAEKYNKTNIQIALNWLANQSNVVTLVKSSNPHHLNEIIQSIGWEMTAKDTERLTQEFPHQRHVSEAVPLS
jgi:diketogulonate reductase-like aldo/keto reductase